MRSDAKKKLKYCMKDDMKGMSVEMWDKDRKMMIDDGCTKP